MANRQLFVNNLNVTLSNGIDANATAIALTDASAFPALADGDFLTLTLFKIEGDEETAREIVKVTGVSGNTITVERGFDGTQRLAWSLGTKAELRNNAFTLSRLRDAAATAQTAANAATNTAAAALKPSDLTSDDGATKVNYKPADGGPVVSLKVALDGIKTALGSTGQAVPIASANAPGLIKPSTTILVDPTTGVATAKIPNATGSAPGIVQIGSGITLSGGVISVPPAAPYVPQDATKLQTGVVQIGTGMSVANGSVSVEPSPLAGAI
ncbi:MAG: hypothetical protein ACTHKB_08190, partial [Burkholderiaceae bacterium]